MLLESVKTYMHCGYVTRRILSNLSILNHSKLGNNSSMASSPIRLYSEGDLTDFITVLLCSSSINPIFKLSLYLFGKLRGLLLSRYSGDLVTSTAPTSSNFFT